MPSISIANGSSLAEKRRSQFIHISSPSFSSNGAVPPLPFLPLPPEEPPKSTSTSCAVNDGGGGGGGGGSRPLPATPSTPCNDVIPIPIPSTPLYAATPLQPQRQPSSNNYISGLHLQRNRSPPLLPPHLPYSPTGFPYTPTTTTSQISEVPSIASSSPAPSLSSILPPAGGLHLRTGDGYSISSQYSGRSLRHDLGPAQHQHATQQHHHHQYQRRREFDRDTGRVRSTDSDLDPDGEEGIELNRFNSTSRTGINGNHQHGLYHSASSDTLSSRPVQDLRRQRSLFSSVSHQDLHNPSSSSSQIGRQYQHQHQNSQPLQPQPIQHRKLPSLHNQRRNVGPSQLGHNSGGSISSSSTSRASTAYSSSGYSTLRMINDRENNRPHDQREEGEDDTEQAMMNHLSRFSGTTSLVIVENDRLPGGVARTPTLPLLGSAMARSKTRSNSNNLLNNTSSRPDVHTQQPGESGYGAQSTPSENTHTFSSTMSPASSRQEILGQSISTTVEGEQDKTTSLKSTKSNTGRGRGRRCCCYCVIFFILLVLAAVGAGLGWYFAIYKKSVAANKHSNGVVKNTNPTTPVNEVDDPPAVAKNVTTVPITPTPIPTSPIPTPPSQPVVNPPASNPKTPTTKVPTTTKEPNKPAPAPTPAKTSTKADKKETKETKKASNPKRSAAANENVKKASTLLTHPPAVPNDHVQLSPNGSPIGTLKTTHSRSKMSKRMKVLSHRH